jgi:hypothetical protein
MEDEKQLFEYITHQIIKNINLFSHDESFHLFEILPALKEKHKLFYEEDLWRFICKFEADIYTEVFVYTEKEVGFYTGKGHTFIKLTKLYTP